MEHVARRPVVLVTGASTGLGLALARLLRKEGAYHLVLTARATSLDRFASEGFEEADDIWLRPLDVTSDAERRTLIAELERELGGVDILINNAAIAYRSVIEHVTEEERLDQMRVNFQAPIALAQLVLPSMRSHGTGRIINVSSAAGIMAVPTMGLYAASKFALEGATEALFYETKPWGIRVSLVLPGFIRSAAFERVVLSGQSRTALADASDGYHRHYAHMIRFIDRVMRHTPATPESVARTIVRTLRRSRPPLRVAATWDARLFWWFRRFAPQPLYHAIMYGSFPGVSRWGPLAQAPGRPLALPSGVSVEHSEAQSPARAAPAPGERPPSTATHSAAQTIEPPEARVRTANEMSPRHRGEEGCHSAASS